MADKKRKSEPEFIRGTVLASILLLLIFIAAGVVFSRNPDAVRGAAVRTLSSLGNFSAAAELAGDMDGDEARAQSLYHVAEKMLSGGSFEEAAELFKSLGEYSDSAAKYLEAEYAYADALYNDGSYERAMEVFSAVSTYGDAAERQKACVYAMAVEAYEGGEYLRASTLFAGLSSYEDAQERAFDAALRITGDADAAAVIVSSGGLSAEAAEKAADIAMLRSSLPLGRLAVGSYHTVYIRDDGTAAACGDNSDGRCDVSGWTELVQVCAGAKHTAALRADGTVVAAGDDSYGQCDVGDWRNVIAIAAGEYDTVALLADGSIVSCGYHSYDSLKGADQYTRIFAGSYGAAAVNSLGLYGLKGIILGLVSAVTYAVIVMLNKTLKDISAGDRTIMQLGISSIVMLPYVLLTENVAALEVTFAPVMLLLVAGIVHTGFAYTLYFGGIAGIPAQTAAVLSYIDPITAILLSVVLLREDMSAVSAIGCVLVIGAMLVSEIEPKKKRIPAAEQ